MNKLLALSIVVMLAGCASTPTSDHNNVMIEEEIRLRLNKPTGELTKADLEKVTKLYLMAVVERKRRREREGVCMQKSKP